MVLDCGVLALGRKGFSFESGLICEIRGFDVCFYG